MVFLPALLNDLWSNTDACLPWCLIGLMLFFKFVYECAFTMPGPVFFFSSPSLGSCQGNAAAARSLGWDRCLCVALRRPQPPAAAGPQWSSGRPTLGLQNGSLPSDSVQTPFLGHKCCLLPSTYSYVHINISNIGSQACRKPKLNWQVCKKLDHDHYFKTFSSFCDIYHFQFNWKQM